MSFLEEGKILVTGGAGFIGSSLIWALNERGINNILVTDFLGEGDKYQNLVPLSFDDYLEADHFLKKMEDTPTLFADIKLILHLGACSSTSEQNNRYLIENNFEYTKKLARWALANDMRMVYASSAATYGDGEHGMDDKDTRLDRLRPLNMYGYSKHLFDLYAHRHGLSSSLVGLKYFNIFGPNVNHKSDMRSVVNKAYAQVRETGKIRLFKSYHPDYADGEQKRDFLYVKDAAVMTLYLAEQPNAAGLFNIGSGEANTWLSLVRPIFSAMGKPEQIEMIEMPEWLREKYQYYTCADISKLRATGYDKTITPLADAVTDYVKSYLAPDKRLGD